MVWSVVCNKKEEEEVVVEEEKEKASVVCSDLSLCFRPRGPQFLWSVEVGRQLGPLDVRLKLLAWLFICQDCKTAGKLGVADGGLWCGKNHVIFVVRMRCERRRGQSLGCYFRSLSLNSLNKSGKTDLQTPFARLGSMIASAFFFF